MQLDIPETQRARRGHDFYVIPDETPALYATEMIGLSDKTIWAHFFGPSQDWYIAEVDRDNGLAFGYCDLGIGFPEWGYVDLTELEEINAQHGLVVIERDCYWEPKPFSEIQR